MLIKFSQKIIFLTGLFRLTLKGWIAADKKLPGGKGIPRAVPVLRITLMYKFRDVCSGKVHKKMKIFKIFFK